MFPQSIRYRLPLTYAAIALLTALALSVILLVTLRLYYQQQESLYVFQIGGPISEALVRQLAAGADASALQSEAERLGLLYQVRLRLRDAEGVEIADSGPPGLFAPLALEAPTAPVAPPPEGSPTQSAAEATLVPIEGEISPPRIRPVWLEAIYGFDPTRRSPATMEFRLADPSTERYLGSLSVSDGPAYGSAIVARVAQVSVAAGLAAVLLAAATGWWISRRITIPLTVLNEVTTRMAQGQLSARAPVTSLDEIGLLAHTFNNMAGRVETTVTALRNFIGDSAHELHTPLTALRTNLDLARGTDDLATQKEFVARAQAQAGRLQSLADDLLDLSRLDADPSSAGLAPIDLAALVRELGEVYASRAEQAGLGFHLDVPDAPAFIHGDLLQVRRALGNVLDNAIKFTPAGGQVTLSIYSEDQWLVTAAMDTGIGIPTGDVPLLFNRFHRGRNTTHYPGSGLGLAIVKAIVSRHGGLIELESSASGTRAVLKWPAAQMRS